VSKPVGDEELVAPERQQGVAGGMILLPAGRSVWQQSAGFTLAFVRGL
jgi:hypothetical protein